MDFTELVTTENRGLVAAVVAIIGDVDKAEDIVQDAFERCYARWWRISRYDRPGAWVRRVAINAAISARRRATVEQRSMARVAALTSPNEADGLVDLNTSEIWAAVRALPDDQVTAVVLRYAADLSIEAIAQDMALSASAVKSLLHRARRELRCSPAMRRQLDA